MPATLRLRSMKVACEDVPHSSVFNVRQKTTGLATVIAAMCNHMGKHLLPRHTALSAIGESEVDHLFQLVGRKAQYIVQIPFIGLPDRGGEIGKGRRLPAPTRRVPMKLLLQVGGEDPSAFFYFIDW
jgi:hypothetical protein